MVILLAFIVFKENKLLSKWFYIGFSIIAVAIIIHVLLLVKQERKHWLKLYRHHDTSSDAIRCIAS